MEKSKPQNQKYFAAANGYNGFVSYFDKIFDPRKHERIYVLKGGPGTGKSTFMKKLAIAFEEKSISVECIHCSSDPRSLDGVILNNGERKVAVIDGTAPHERDALIPGAFDEITDLSQAWDMRWLKAQREEISILNIQKSNAYKAAYHYLALAGKANEPGTAAIRSLNGYEIRDMATKIAAEFKTDANRGWENLRLISAFGAVGSITFDTIKRASDTLYALPDTIVSRILLSEIYSRLSADQIELTVCKNPLDSTLTDAIFIPSNGIGIVCGENDNTIDTSKLSTPTEPEKEAFRVANDIYELAIREAKRWFAIASDMHMRLENIYSNAVDFSIIDDIYAAKFTQIREILT